MFKRQRSEWSKPPFEFRKRRLDLVASDGGAWFAANIWWEAWKPDTGMKKRSVHPHSLRTARGTRFHLLGMLLETQAVLCDKVVVHLCAANALERQLAPHLAARYTMHTLATSTFGCDSYVAMLRDALLERYCYKTSEPDARLVIAVFQQLQLPFGSGYYVLGYPLPLHRFPVLKPGHYVNVNHHTLNEWNEPVVPFSCLATGYEHVLAFVQVWWNVLKWCTRSAETWFKIGCKIGDISMRHRYMWYAWNRMAAVRVERQMREAATFIWEKECKQSIFCDE